MNGKYPHKTINVHPAVWRTAMVMATKLDMSIGEFTAWAIQYMSDHEEQIDEIASIIKEVQKRYVPVQP